MNHWHAVVTRKLEVYGPGTFTLYKNYDVFKEWPCKTGHLTIDPHEYGGLTPPINFVMIESIAEREHPMFGYKLDMARIIPVGCGMQFFLKRTWNIWKDAFMLHAYISKSTGCPAIEKDYWKEAKEWINKAFTEEHFLISVRNI